MSDPVIPVYADRAAEVAAIERYVATAKRLQTRGVLPASVYVSAGMSPAAVADRLLGLIADQHIGRL